MQSVMLRYGGDKMREEVEKLQMDVVKEDPHSLGGAILMVVLIVAGLWLKTWLEEREKDEM